MKGEELMKEIRAFAPHTEVVSLTTLMASSVEGVNVINISPPGQGKSRSTKELLDLIGADYQLVTGKLTPKAFFKLVRKHNDELLLFDESTVLVSDKEILNMLLCLLWNGFLTWETDKGREEFTFLGNIIFNVNRLPNTPFVDALKDRCFVNSFNLSASQVQDKINSDYEPDQKVWAEIKERLGKEAEISEADLNKEIRSFLERLQPPSVRAEWKAKKAGLFLKRLFGTMDKLHLFFDVSPIYSIISSDKKRAEKVKEIAEFKKVSKRQARNIIAKYE